jgi:hypothetical protein
MPQLSSSPVTARGTGCTGATTAPTRLNVVVHVALVRGGPDVVRCGDARGTDAFLAPTLDDAEIIEYRGAVKTLAERFGRWPPT